jgi:hypothetical protein
MLRGTRGKVIPLRERDVVADGNAAAELEALQAGSLSVACPSDAKNRHSRCRW